MALLADGGVGGETGAPEGVLGWIDAGLSAGEAMMVGGPLGLLVLGGLRKAIKGASAASAAAEQIRSGPSRGAEAQAGLERRVHRMETLQMLSGPPEGSEGLATKIGEALL